jgi:hypothetical protein
VSLDDDPACLLKKLKALEFRKKKDREAQTTASSEQDLQENQAVLEPDPPVQEIHLKSY